jgi:Leucine-rich repeat (LRR) protein
MMMCGSNQLTTLPELPSTLQQCYCDFNQLTRLPPLPSSLDVISCNANQFISLPELPSQLTYLSCSINQLTSLPSLPHGLNRLYCSSNELETLPDLPSTLVSLACILPYNDCNYICNEMTPEQVQQINHENQEWMEYLSKERCMKRCSIYYEELMHNRWNPERIIQLYDMGYKPEDM